MLRLARIVCYHLASLTTLCLAQSGVTWRTLHPTPPATVYSTLVSFHGVNYAFGDHGTVAATVTGDSWSSQSVGTGNFDSAFASDNEIAATASPATEPGLSYIGSRPITFASSRDGKVWSHYSTNLSQGKLTSLARDASGWIGLWKHDYSSDFPPVPATTSFVRSIDGAHWTVLSNFDTQMASLIYDNGKIYVVGYGILSSDDGIVWTREIDGNFASVVRAGVHGLVAVGERTISQNSGSGWVRRRPGESLTWHSLNFTKVIWTGTELVAISSDDNETSTDGITWQAQSYNYWSLHGDVADALWLPNDSSSGTILSVLKGGGIYRGLSWEGNILLPYYGPGTACTHVNEATYVVVTDHGVDLSHPSHIHTFTPSGASMDWKLYPWMTDAFTGVASSGATIVAVTDKGNVARSTDAGATWDILQFVVGRDVSFFDVIYADGNYVAVGLKADTEAILATSATGETWTAGTAPGNASRLNSIKYDGSQWLTSDGYGLWTSPDASTWTLQEGPQGGISGFASHAGILVTVGDYLYSNATGTWADHTPFNSGFRGVAWGGTNFVAVTYLGIVYTSAEGVAWQQQANSLGDNIRSIREDGPGVMVTGDYSGVTVSDSTPIASFSAETPVVVESDGFLTVNCDLNLPPPTDLDLPYTLAGTATSPADYEAPARQVFHFEPGQTRSTVRLSLINDTQPEPTEHVTLTLSPTPGVRLADSASVEVPIQDNDGPPRASFAMTSQHADESVGVMGVSVELSWPATSPVVIPIIITGTATEPADFQVLRTHLTVGNTAQVSFAPGERFKSLKIRVADDTDEEPDETIILTMGTPTGAILGDGTVTSITINANDTPGAEHWQQQSPYLPAADLYAINSLGSGMPPFPDGSGLVVVTVNPLAEPVPNCLVVGGDHGLIMTSDDLGNTWVQRFTGEDGNIVKLVNFKGLLVAVTDADDGFTPAHLLTSIDGIVWSRRDIPLLTGIQALYSDGQRLRMAARTADGSIILGSSADALSWRQDLTLIDNSMSSYPSVTQGLWTGSQQALVTEDESSNFQLWLSQDGLTYTALEAPELKQLLWSRDHFVGFDSHGQISTSTDGLVWKKQGSPSKLHYSATVQRDGIAIAVGTGAARSDKGGKWTQRSTGLADTLDAVVAFGGRYFAVGRSTIASSLDGLTWTPFGTSPVGNGDLTDVVWTGSRFIAVGNQGHERPALSKPKVIVSTDGASWVERPCPAKERLNSVAWSGSLAVAVGNNGVICTSIDGLKWAQRSSGTLADLDHVIWNGSQFVAVGGTFSIFSEPPVTPILLTSPDGLHWTNRPVPTQNHLATAASNGRKTLVLTDGFFQTTAGDLLDSDDGVHWHTNQFSGITCLGGNANGFIRVLRDGTSSVSPDGVEWNISSYSTLAPTNARIVWDGNRWLGIADRSVILGTDINKDWQPVSSPTSRYLSGIASNGRITVVVGSSGSIFTYESSIIVPPVASFAETTATLSENNGHILVTVALTHAPHAPLSFALVIGGSASAVGADADVNPLPTELTFGPGETSKSFQINVRDDHLVEDEESLSIELITPLSGEGVVSEDRSHFYLTITDNDQLPVITTEPDHALIPQGQPLGLTVAANGSGKLSYQWQRNGARIPGATLSTYSVASAALINAGSYTVTVSNDVGGVTSRVAEVGVFEQRSFIFAGSASRSRTIHQAAAGKGLTFDWVRLGHSEALAVSAHVALSQDRSTLTIKAPMELTDEDSYFCRIYQTASDRFASGGNSFELHLTDAKPNISPLPLADVIVGTPVALQGWTRDGTSPSVSQWSASGLPKGLTINPLTGIIEGSPAERAKNVPITIVAGNDLGSTSVITHLTVTGLPNGIAGGWVGLIDISGTDNSSLGSRFDLTITNSGRYTGRYSIGSAYKPIDGVIEMTDWGAAKLSFTIAQGGEIENRVAIWIDPSSQPSFSGHIRSSPTDDQPALGTSVQAWHRHPDPRSLAVRYHFDLPQDRSREPYNFELPLGTSFGMATVTAKGNASVVGRLADGNSFTTASPLGENGECLIYSPQYGDKGGIIGIPAVSVSEEDGPRLIACTDIHWSKPLVSTAFPGRLYPHGWGTATLVLYGAQYKAPARGSLPMDLTYTAGTPNLEAIFAGAKIYDAIDSSFYTQEVNLRANGQIDPVPDSDPSHQLSLNLRASTGSFRGTVKLSDTLPVGLTIHRAAIFEGLIVPAPGETPSFRAVGFVLVPQLPDGTVTPTPDPKQTPILSGDVGLRLK